MLRKDGYDVIEAKTGAELLDALTGQLLQPIGRPPADLIISDLRMPGFTGLEILSGLRRDSLIPFILITAFGGEEVRSEALGRGAAAASEPFEIEDLRVAVVKLIGGPRS